MPALSKIDAASSGVSKSAKAVLGSLRSLRKSNPSASRSNANGTMCFAHASPSKRRAILNALGVGRDLRERQIAGKRRSSSLCPWRSLLGASEIGRTSFNDITEPVRMDVQADIGHVVKVFAGNEPDNLADHTFGIVIRQRAKVFCSTFFSFVSSVT